MDATRVLPSILRLRWSRCCCMTNKSASVIDADTQSSSSPTADRVAERKSKRLVRSSLVDIDRLCCTRWCHAHPDSRAGHTYSARCCAVHCCALSRVAVSTDSCGQCISTATFTQMLRCAGETLLVFLLAQRSNAPRMCERSLMLRSQPIRCHDMRRYGASVQYTAPSSTTKTVAHRVHGQICT